MNYLDFLTQENKTNLCEIITGKDFKDLFKRNEQEFSKIKKGFRAKSLTEQQALNLAIANVDKPFIALWINMTVEAWLKEIHENIEKLESKGSAHDTALATTLLDSYFATNVDLFFILTEQNPDADERSNLHEMMESINSERAKTAEASERIKLLEEEKRELLVQIDKAQKSVNTIKTEYEQKIQKIEEEKEKLESLLDESREKISELQTASGSSGCDDAEYLAQFDDTDTSVLPSLGSDEIFSLCGVNSDFNGQKWIIRYADLSYNGQYNLFIKNENAPPYFSNRDKLFYKDGPSGDGYYGVWAWSATPNDKDPSKDYIISRYNMRPDAIEIITVSDAKNLDELVNILKKGIEYRPHCRRIIVSYYASKGQYIGVLCSANTLSTVNDITSFSADCIEVPVYEFNKSDILRLENGLAFYKKAFAGIPFKLYRVKTPLEIVKKIVFSSISWTAYKTKGVSRAEYKTFKDLIGAIPVNDITAEIETACHCSDSSAEKLLDEFLNVVCKYVDNNSLEDDILLSAVSSSSELQERTKALIRSDWEKENTSLLDEAYKELESLDSKLKAASENLAAAQEKYKETKQEEERLSGIIAEKEKLAEDVEAAVAERIQKAKENAADFIANMAFAGNQLVPTVNVSTAAAASISPLSVISPYHVFSAVDNTDDLDEYHSWTDAVNIAAFELEEAGVAEKYSRSLAAFLCAAYSEKQPIILVGPNATDIVQAFSATIASHKYGELRCEGSFSSQAISEIGNNEENIVMITNLISGEWMNRLPEILSQKGIFYVATHPYAEDIQVEPKSLFGFMLPIFTEFFVDRKATGKYLGGYCSDDFIETIKIPAGKYKDLKALSKLKTNSLVRSQISKLVGAMHIILPEITTDEEFILAVLPIAYATLEISKLSELLADSQKDIAISESLKRDLQYILGEI